MEIGGKPSGNLHIEIHKKSTVENFWWKTQIFPDFKGLSSYVDNCGKLIYPRVDIFGGCGNLRIDIPDFTTYKSITQQKIAFI